ncbi:MAG TPA: hypothetical protein VFT29_19060 [Gemmatimonadaceae bacterium]|nr:hypothetical protein [Gemmatimonadaceae bacterium]
MIPRSAALLVRLIASGFTAQQLATDLAISAADVEAYASARLVMPLHQQKSLALFVIRNSPRFASLGHTLKAQVAAAATFKAGATRVHNGPPLGWSSMRRK